MSFSINNNNSTTTTQPLLSLSCSNLLRLSPPHQLDPTVEQQKDTSVVDLQTMWTSKLSHPFVIYFYPPSNNKLL